jgi:proteasome accessory factor B
MPSSKSAAKAERLLNLVIALLNSERFRDVSWIRDKVAGYREATSDEAFFRMFERDKTELRDLGIPLQTKGESYRIPPGQYLLPEMTFTAGEKAALALAGRLWETSVLGEAGADALRKLSDASGDELAASHNALQTRVRTSDPAFEPLYAAVQLRQPVTFAYRKGTSATTETRRLHPWGLVSWRGRWYVVGHDTDRQERRTFRLSRIAGPVTPGKAGAVTSPDNVDLLTIVASADPPAEHRTAIIWLAPAAGAGLRRLGKVAEPDDGHADTPPVPGGDRLEVPMDHLWDTARAVAALGADAYVESPADLRDAVIRLLTDASGPSTLTRPEPSLVDA